jgi:hypothetical protein
MPVISASVYRSMMPANFFKAFSSRASMLGGVLFREPMHEHRSCLIAEQNQGPKSARPALPLATDSLLDDSSTQISVDQSTGSAMNRLAQIAVSNRIPDCEARESAVLENPHRTEV